MKFKYNSKLQLFFAVSCALTAGTQAFAQDSDNVLAYRSSGKALAEGNDLDSEIFAAMQALDEVGALLDDRADAPKNSAVKNDDKIQKQNQTIPESHVDIDSLLAAANAPEQPTTKAVNAAPTPPKHDIQTPTTAKLSAKIDSPAPKHDIQTPTTAKLSAKIDAPAPKHDIQNPTTAKLSAKIDAPAPKHDIQNPTTAKLSAKIDSPAPKHDIQNPTTAKLSAKIDSPAPKHDIQTPTTAKLSAKIDSPAPKHDLQAAAKTSHTTKANASRVSSGSQPNAAGSSTSSQALAYISDVYQINGVDLKQKIGNDRPSIGDVYQYAFKHSLVYQTTRPAIGDLVFFHNTFDRNRDGRWNDWHSLVGIVESVGDDETITVLVYTTKIEKISLNLKYPELKTRKGGTINSQLRPDEGSHIGSAAKLFAGFANLLGDIPSVTVIDNWQPGMRLR